MGQTPPLQLQQTIMLPANRDEICSKLDSQVAYSQENGVLKQVRLKRVRAQ